MLRAVTCQRMSHFMPHNHVNAVVVLRPRHYSLPASDFASGQGEGMDVFVLDHVELAFVCRFVGHGGDALPDTSKLGLPIAPSREITLV
jgi:hypothetical protein